MNRLTAIFFHTAAVRRMASLAALLIGCLATYAGDNKVWIENFTIIPGEVATVEVNLDNEDPVSSLQFDVYLPKGLAYVENSIERVTSRITRSSHSLEAGKQTDVAGKDFYRLGFLSNSSAMETSAVKGNSGAVVKIKVKAESTFAGGQLLIRNIIGSNATVDPAVRLDMPEQTVDVTAQVATAGLASQEMSLRAGVPALIDVTLANNADIVAFQATVTLPEGVSFTEGADGEWVTYSNRLSENVVANIKNVAGSANSYILILTSLTNDVFEGTEGVLFSLNVVTDKEFAEGEVKFSDISLSTTYGISYSNPEMSVALKALTDVTGDGVWDVNDLYDVIGVMTGKTENAYADTDASGMVDIDDIYAAIRKMMEAADKE